MSTAEVTAIALREPPAELTIEQIVAQTRKIQECIKLVMKDGEHFGVIPGSERSKPTLLKPGAEKLCLLFRLDPQYDIKSATERTDLISFTVCCTLYHIPTSLRVASGLGSCNSREDKYRRPAPKKCPNCQKETIFKSKDERGGWFCWAKKGGCGRTYKDGDETIEKQETGLKDPADLHNTILKMASKRALIAAVLNATAASDFFTQDLEDLTDKAAEYIPPKDASAPKDAAPTAEGNGSSTAVGAKTASRTASTTKPPRANTVKHDGTFASHKQVTLLHVLKAKIGGLTEDTYRKQLAAFKDCDGKPITSSKDLSEAQISNLLDRYDAQIKRQAAKAADDPDLGAVTDVNTDRKDLDELEAAFNGSQLSAAEVCSMFNVDNLGELDREQASQALALVLAHGTKSYQALLDRVFPREPGAEG